MEELGDAQDADPSRDPDDKPPQVVSIAPQGDAVLDVIFETSKETLKSARKATQLRPGQRIKDAARQPLLKTRLRVAYRVDIGVLRRQSKYFDSLLGDTRFKEAKTVAAALETLSLRNTKPADAEPGDLPWVQIHDDDEASRSAGRDVVFGELLRILHGKQTMKTAKNPPTLAELATLAVLSDRLTCTAPASAYLRNLRFRFPQIKTVRQDGAPPRIVNEEAIRQKVLISWLMDQPLVFHAATKELIFHGSRRWSPYAEDDKAFTASWWDLPDDLERELQTRRECVLNCIMSVQRHFVSLYTSRNQVCKMGYGSSAACDSFQLGEMIKFLATKDLLFFVDLSPASLEQLPDSIMDIHSLLSTLKQCPSYQIDGHHTNCGLRTKLLPILDYVQTMLSSNVVAIARSSWENSRAAITWVSEGRDNGADDDEQAFRFTRSVAGDQRLRFEGAMAADRMARQLFTARTWDWTPEE